MKQPSFASLAYDGKKKQTRKEKFLAEMGRIIPWQKLTKMIRPYYPKAGNGRRPMGLEKMLRIHFMQQWFKLSDPAMEDALYDTEPLRRFAGIELGQDAVPDESTILKFRHLLEKHNLAAKLFEATCGYLEENGLLLREGTIVDATLIDAPSSKPETSLYGVIIDCGRGMFANCGNGFDGVKPLYCASCGPVPPYARGRELPVNWVS